MVETEGIIKGVVEDLIIGQPAPLIAAKFHTTLGEIARQVCCQIRELTGLGRVAMSGRRLSERTLLDQGCGKPTGPRFRGLHA